MRGIPANSFRKVRIVRQYKRGIEKYVNKQMLNAGGQESKEKKRIKKAVVKELPGIKEKAPVVLIA